MLALIAALCFLLATFDVKVNHVSLIALGLFFLALHLVFPVGLGRLGSRRR